jgi:phage protein D/phage baseplate assembly protein gpV
VSERFPVDAVPDRPEFEVRVAGSALEPLLQRDVVEIDVAEEVNRHGRLTLLVQNWDADSRAVRYSDEGPFAPGAEIEVLLGYHSELESLFAGVITGLTGHFSASRGPTMRVEARSKSVLLSHPPRSRLYEETSDGDVAQAIAADYGLDSDVEDGSQRAFAVVDDRPDWEYLVERARELGWVTYVRGDRLVFRPPTERKGEPPLLSWGLNLTEIHLTQDLARIADPIVATGWDPAELETLDAEADEGAAGIPTGDRPGHGAALQDAGWPLRRRLVPATTASTPAALELRVGGGARVEALEHVSGYGSTIGLPRLRADSWIDIAKVGDRLGGPHYLGAVRHRLSDRGYVTEFQLGLPRPLRPPSAQAACSALQIGVVQDLDDPLGWGRVKVGLPWRSDALESIWARLATLDAGPSQGTLFIPDVGHEVVVGFLGGDSSQPVVLGSLWNGQQAPPEAIDPDANAVRSIVTRSGHKIRFDDGGAAMLEVATAEGHSIVLTDADGGSIELSDPNGSNRIKVSGDGIEIEAGSGDVTISAPAGKVAVAGSGFEAKASGPAKVESSATLDLKASATLGIRGALVNIN